MDKTSVKNFCIFDTAIGWCGLAWVAKAAVRLQLPEQSRAEMKRRLLEDLAPCKEVKPEDAPVWVQDAVGRIQRHLLTGDEDLAKIPVDLTEATAFYQLVFKATMAIPAGKTSTYGELAVRVGSPGGARAVGQALGRNPLALIVPCHRVTAANGKPGGFSAWGGLETKARILAVEAAGALTSG